MSRTKFFSSKSSTVFVGALMLGAVVMLAGCEEEDGDSRTSIGGLTHIGTDISQCNTFNPEHTCPRDKDTVEVTFSSNRVNVLVGHRYRCEAEFEARTEAKDGLLYMYLIDTFDYRDSVMAPCGFRYNTFNFIFKSQGVPNQAYKILLTTPKPFPDGPFENFIAEGVIGGDISN